MADEKFAQPHLHAAIGRVLRNGAVSREQRQTHLLLALGIEDLNAFEPGLLLTVIDLAQIENVALHDALAAAPTAFHDGPIPMLLAVFKAPVTFQMHDRRSS
jgi:hypothetical protein